MKKVIIYILESYDSKSKSSKYSYYLNYKDAVIKRSITLGCYKDKRFTEMYAIYDAISHMTEPVDILIKSKSDVKFSRGKSKEISALIVDIENTLRDKGCTIQLDCNSDFSQVDKWEQLYGSKNSRREENKNKFEKYRKPNEVFEINKESYNDLYGDLLYDKGSTWVPGSGGY